jgi:O-antigen ligase
MKWLDSAVVSAVTVFPLVFFPGIDRPFSTPKIFLLGGVVIAGGIIAAGMGRLRWPTLPSGFLFSLTAWFCALIVSALWGEFVSQRALWISLLPVGWFLLLTAIRPRPDHIASAVALSGTVVAAIALLQYVGIDPFEVLGIAAPAQGGPRMQVFATLGNPDFVAAFLVSGLPLSLTLGEIAGHRILFAFGALLQGLAVFSTGSRASVLGVTAILFWLGGSIRFSNRLWLAGGVLLIAGLLVFAPSRSLTATINGRLYIWKVNAPHLLERPFFGYGPGGFEPKYIEWETQFWRMGKGSGDDRSFAQLQEHAHNDYIQVLIDSGLAGLFSLLSLLSSLFIFAFRRIRSTQDKLIAGASAGVAAMAAVAIVDFPFHRPTELFLFWTLASIVFSSDMRKHEWAKQPLKD